MRDPLPSTLPSRRALDTAAHAHWRDGHSLAVFGEPGSGRTVFVKRVLRAWPGSVHRYTGSAVLRDVPFAALAAMTAQVPGSTPASPAHLIAALAAGGDSGNRALLLDNAEHIDEASAAALAQAVTDSSLRIILVSTAANKLAAPLRALALTCELIDLEPLTNADASALAEEMLGTVVTIDTAHWLAEASGRNAQYLRELITDAKDSDGFRAASGYLTLKENWQPRGRRISEFVAVRLAHQPDPVKVAVELIAITGQVPRDLAVELAGPEAIEVAIEADLLEVSMTASAHDPDAEFEVVRLGSGLTSQTVIAGKPASDLKWHAERALQFVQKMQPQTRITVMLHAVRAGVRLADPALESIVGEAVKARQFDAVLVFTEADAERSRSEALILARSRALFELGRADEALVGLGSLADRSQPARIWAATIVAADGRIDEAEALLRDRPDDDPLRGSELVARRDVLRARAGREVAVDQLRAHAADASLDADVRASSLQSALLADVLAGRALDVIAEIDALVSGPQWQLVPITEQVELLVTRFIGSVSSGARDDDAGLGDAEWIALRIPPALYLAAGGLSRLVVGDASTASSMLRQTLVALGGDNRFGMTAYLAAAAASASTLLGDDSSTAELAETARASLTVEGQLNSESERMLLLAQVRNDGATAAEPEWQRQVERARQRGDLNVYMRVVHDGWRGGIHSDIALLSDAATGVQGALATALRDYSAALLGDDDALDRALTAHRDAGHTLFAAELAQASLRLARDGSRTRPISLLVTQAVDRLVELVGVDTPILGRVRIDRALLSEREFEVCERALSGRSNAEIAGDLYLSVRTVEGHLQRAFGKLGIAGRQQLGPPPVVR